MTFLKSLIHSLATALSVLIITVLIAYLFGGVLKIIYSILGIEYNDDVIFSHSWIVTIIWALVIIFCIIFGLYIDSYFLVFNGIRIIILTIPVLFFGLFGLFLK